jgi:hypothetical protein
MIVIPVCRSNFSALSMNGSVIDRGSKVLIIKTAMNTRKIGAKA